MSPKTYFLFILLSLFAVEVSAQIDSTYIGPLNHDFSVRTYFVNKITGFSVQTGNDDVPDREFRINAPAAIGVGAAWKSYSFSFSQGFNSLRNKDKGKTSSLEFQYHGYKRKFAYDILLQQHKGVYLENRNSDATYQIYPDVRLSMYGGSFLWVFNNKKFSYKAAFNQSERQIKSAGSFQLGGSVYYSTVRSDSTELFDNGQKSYKNLQFGVTGGYAYTWVLSRRWFLTASGAAGLNLGSNHPNRFFEETLKVYPSFNGRFAAGYNIRSWSFGASVHLNKIYILFGEKKKESLSMNDLNMQVAIVKRFNWGNPFVNKTLNQTKQKLERYGL